MKIKTIAFLVSLSFASISFAATVDIKQSAPNQYDCTVDELELYVMKRTESLRKDSTLVNWEDFKNASARAAAGQASGASVVNGSGAGGNAEAEALALANQTPEAANDEQCNLFYSDMSDVDMSEMNVNMDDASSFFSGGLSSLKDLATAQVTQLGETLANVVKAGFCKRLSTDYLSELAEDRLDKDLKKEYGYTTNDIRGGNFSNKVLNDELREDTGDSNAKLYNLMDDNLNSNRESYFRKQIDTKMNEVEKEIKQ